MHTSLVIANRVKEEPTLMATWVIGCPGCNGFLWAYSPPATLQCLIWIVKVHWCPASRPHDGPLDIEYLGVGKLPAELDGIELDQFLEMAWEGKFRALQPVKLEFIA